MAWGTDEFTGRQLGKYEVLCRLAVGGMAEIFLGFARTGPFVGRPVVIKRILTEQREDTNATRMLLDEAKMTATLNHPNVAEVIDLESDGEELLLVIEFIAGTTIEELVQMMAEQKEAVPLGFAVTLIREAAQGLGHAHGHRNSRGQTVPIIHRDVNPRNVMVSFDGQVKVLDFGIARIKGSERRTLAGMVRGTTAYMSPEQAIGKALDPRTDLFSLGIIFHELLTGQRLFQKGDPSREMAAVYEDAIGLPSVINRRVPKAFDALVMRALDRRIEHRYQSARDFIGDLTRVAASLAWPKERCAALIRERFAARQRDINALVARIPAASSPSGVRADGENSPTDPSWRSLGNDVNTEFARPPPALMAVDQTNQVHVDELFDADDEQTEAQTRIINDTRALLPQAATEAPISPRPPSSRRSIALWVGLALLVGAIGGALLFAAFQPKSLVRLVVTSDRPAAVFIGTLEVGNTPVSVIVPSGHHVLELRDESGQRRGLEVDLTATQSEANLAVSLDSLPRLP